MIINIQIYHFQRINCVLIKNYERYCVEKFSKKEKKNTILFVCRIKKKFHLSTCSIDKKKSCNNSLLISTIKLCCRLSIDFIIPQKNYETSKKKDIYRLPRASSSIISDNFSKERDGIKRGRIL